MKWGTQVGQWGKAALWGVGTGDGPTEFCDLADDRVLVQVDDEPTNRDFRELVCIVVEGLGHYKDVAEDVAAAFDVDTAVGEQLDFIGTIVGIQRQGFPDARYRDFINIQIDLILSTVRNGANWTGTVNNILDICRTFIGTGVPDPIVYTATPPYSFKLTVPGVTPAEMGVLVNFLCIALYAGVLGQSIFTLASDSLWDSFSVGPITDGGIWASASVVVAPSSIWGLTIPIGTQNCE